VDALVSFNKEVAAACPKTPFFYYHFPGITNVNFSAFSFLERASKVIPNLQGKLLELIYFVKAVAIHLVFV
jgi:N-acetylneuraminate lyase